MGRDDVKVGSVGVDDAERPVAIDEAVSQVDCDAEGQLRAVRRPLRPAADLRDLPAVGPVRSDEPDAAVGDLVTPG